jgi:outer membrane immunogenic protein
MRHVALASIAALFVVGAVHGASAADMPSAPVVTKAPAVVPAFNWSGFYVGGFVGGAWGSDASAFDRGGGPFTSYNGAGPHGWSYDLGSSMIGGLTIGYNLQSAGSPIVFGLEGEFGYLRLTGSAVDRIAVGFDTGSSAKVGDWYGMITGRLGYAFDRVLLYVKGGVAFVDTKASVIDACSTGACGVGRVAASASETEVTWTVGGGLEWALNNNWSIKGEYMYIGLDNTMSTCGPATAGPATGTVFCWNHNFDGIHTAKFGFNYRFFR